MAGITFTDMFKTGGLVPPEELTLTITPRCNLSCHHCWPECGPAPAGKPVPLENLLRLIGEWLNAGLANICISGGEPLTHPHWFEIIQFCCRQERFKSVRLQTNGTLFTREIVQSLLHPELNKLTFQISLDGSIPQTHDRLRGTGNFARTCQGLGLLQEMGLTQRSIIAFTETSENIEQLPELLRLIEQLDIGQLLSGTLIMAGRAARNYKFTLPTPGQYINILSQYEKDAEFRRLYRKRAKISAIEWYLHRQETTEKSHCSCMATPYISAEGYLYPCTLLQVEDFAISGVWNRTLTSVVGEIQDRWTELPEIHKARPQRIQKCRDCIGRHHCGSGCLGRSNTESRDFFQVEDRCKLRQAVYTWGTK